jgi:hypothetical protein
MDSIPSADRPRDYDGGYMAVGRQAEKAVMQFLREQPYVLGLDDLRSLRAMREADVDCSVQLYDGRVFLAEIKSDRHLGVSGNVLFEVLRINHTAPAEKACVLGWSARSPATHFLIYAPSVEKIYHCRANDFRQCFQRYSKNHRKRMNISIVPTDCLKTTINVLIPWDYCQDVFYVHRCKTNVS